MSHKNKMLFDKADNYLLFVTKRASVVMERGEGMYVWDVDGKKYLDFIGGWAVTSLGHCPPCLHDALKEQSHILINSSPSFVNSLMIELAELLVEHSCFDKVWFGNTGAEVNEAAVKLARKYGQVKKNGAFEIITAQNSFHGRTLAMMSATGKEQFKPLFEPKVPGFVHVPFNDYEALEQVVSEQTVGIMLEPVQGEGGVNVASLEYLQKVRKLCNDCDMVFILDEIQTGMGRTGTMFCHEHYGVEPDVMTLAKGIGSGYPLAALLAKEKFCLFEPGEHGGTFGGQPLSMAVGIAVFKEILNKKLYDNAKKMGEYLVMRLLDSGNHGRFRNIRGKGLLIAADLEREIGSTVVAECLDKGLIINSPCPSTLRFIPPLIVTKEDVDAMVDILNDVLINV